MKFQLSTTTLLLLGMAVCVHCGKNEDTTSKPTKPVCSVYLAESSLPSAKREWGVFAGVDYEPGDRIGGNNIGGLAIQILDFKKKFAEQMIGEHSSSPVSVGGEMEGAGIGTLLPGLATLINFHPSLHNIVVGGASFDQLLDRYEDPGAGAFTGYHDTPIFAGQNIKAGDELFHKVSDAWFLEHDPELPIASDYKIVDDFMNRIYEMYIDTSFPNVSDTIIRDILRRAKYEVLNSAIWQENKEYIHKLVPTSLEELKRIATMGTARAELDDIDPLWLQDRGLCLDNIVEGVSTIDQAGRGAFAAKPIADGNIIAPAPLLHMMNWEDLNVNESSDRKDILLNYCFGHEMSLMLLCPTTSVTLINHSETPNARIQWASEPEFSDDDWRSASLEELKDEYRSVLMFEVVATRDIEEGEEIFIDYGNRWKQAWEDHVVHWSSPPIYDGQGEYVASNILNKYNFSLMEDVLTAYPHSLYICLVEPYIQSDPPESQSPVPIQDFFANPSISMEAWDNSTKIRFGRGQADWWYPCDVLKSNEAENKYTTRIYDKVITEHEDGVLSTGGRTIREVFNTPREAIRFVDKPYHSNQFLENTFRHEIGIPDELFPLHWRDDYVDGNVMLRSWGKEKWDEQSFETIEKHNDDLREAKCGLYYAPSTIPAAGKGIYAGIDIKAQLNVESVIPSIIIPEIGWNDTKDSVRWDAQDYTWDGTAYGAEFECTDIGNLDSQVLAFDIGMMGNFHPGLVNSYLGSINFAPLLERNKDPGAGSFSDYDGHTFVSNRDIKAGNEIFISYGEAWFDSRPFLHHVPLSANYVEANSIVSSVISILTGSKVVGIEDSIVERIWSVFKNVTFEARTKSVVSKLNTVQDLIKVMHLKGTAEVESEPRSMSWLEENGECIDHIYVNTSTVTQAGRGAYARRFISDGDVIIASPMLNNWGRQKFNLNVNRTGVDGEANEKQLIYNYMYAHPNSTLLLFPVTRVNMINHKSIHDGIGPNARLRWSTSDKKTQYYLQRHLEDLRKEHYATLVIEYVATRDIQPDEEIFIDYGDDWDNAWQEHVDHFETLKSSSNLGKDFSSHIISKINGDRLNRQWHNWTNDYFTVCNVHDIPQLDTDEWVELVPNQDYFGISYDHKGFDLLREGSWCPCVIIRLDGEKYFDVAIFAIGTENEDQRYVRRVRTAQINQVEWRPIPGKSDQHWSGAFRHEIKIPESMFPSHWQDLTLSDTVPRAISNSFY